MLNKTERVESVQLILGIAAKTKKIVMLPVTCNDNCELLSQEIFMFCFVLESSFPNPRDAHLVIVPVSSKVRK